MEIEKKIKQEIEKIVVSEGLELVHIEYRPQGHGFVLRVDIDKEGGVGVDDCALISTQLGAMLDVEEFGGGRYDLEVSSPGLDRRFYSESDYRKFTDHLVRVRTSEAVRGIHVIVGRLTSFDGSTVVLKDETQKKDPIYEIELANIKETRLELEV